MLEADGEGPNLTIVASLDWFFHQEEKAAAGLWRVYSPLSLLRAERPVLTFAGAGGSMFFLRARNKHFFSHPQSKSSRPPYQLLSLALTQLNAAASGRFCL